VAQVAAQIDGLGRAAPSGAALPINLWPPQSATNSSAGGIAAVPCLPQYCRRRAALPTVMPQLHCGRFMRPHEVGRRLPAADGLAAH